MRKCLTLCCVALTGPAHAQTYNYIPPLPVPPPTYYAPPPFIPAQPIPMVPIPSFHPPALLPTQPYYQSPNGSYNLNNDEDD